VHGLDDGARAPCIAHGARVVFACSLEGAPHWGVPGSGRGQAEGTRQRPALVSSICHCPAAALPHAWPSHVWQPLGSHKGGVFSKQLQMENKKKKKKLTQGFIF